MNPEVAHPAVKRSRGQTLMDSFQQYRAELDEHHDRREKIIKQSRDITALSKKAIFAAHRITNTDKEVVVQEVESKMKDLKAMFARVQPELEGENFWRYERSISPGIQEYLEAVIFYNYLINHKIMSLGESQDSLAGSQVPQTGDQSPPAAAETRPLVNITVSDYLGGVADVTGEMMRLAIGSVGKSLQPVSSDGQEHETEFSIDSIGRMVRSIKSEMDSLVPFLFWLEKKMSVMDASLSKIELASYNLKIRGAEFAGAPARLAALAERNFSDDDSLR
ncbi:hypothetical protein OIO90_004777 [Microbotryomycetes sp. JL221]|nr:hypothetical protein OIO90_004777 [Microbotryomycetes sp. JL221]